MTATLTVNGADVSDVTRYDVTVTCGREDVADQPDSSVLVAILDGWTDAGKVGDTVHLRTADGRLIFHGWVTDLAAIHDNGWTTNLTATGPLAALGNTLNSWADYPQETDSQRIDRILTEAGALSDIDTGVLGPQILARPGDQVNAATLARKTADDGLGVLWEDPSDETAPIKYNAHRTRGWNPTKQVWGELPPTAKWSDAVGMKWTDTVGGASPLITVDPHAAPDEIGFAQTVKDYAAKHTVEYGTGDPRPTATAGSGQPHKKHDTFLADVSDAEDYASTMLRRTGRPQWRLQQLAIDLDRMTAGNAADLIDRLQVGARMEIPLPLGSPVGVHWQGYLEGWQHHLIGEGYGDTHILMLQVSDRQLTEPAMRWADVQPALKWVDVPADMSWTEAVNV